MSLPSQTELLVIVATLNFLTELLKWFRGRQK